MFHSRTLNNRINDLHFEYCSLCWMFHSRTLNNRINHLHFRALRLTYKDESFSFNELLKKDGSVRIHHLNVQKLAIELYKPKNGLSPIMMHDIFPDRNYNGPDIRSQKEFELPKINTVNNGQETLRFMGPKIWDIIPNSIKKASSLSIFKNKIKNWVPEDCPCRLCKDYVQGVGYVCIT